jgi:DNA-binding LacI/PurR family transcriptional regulator
MKRSKTPVTQSEIARKAGVSQAAVSAILSGSGSVAVSDETRASILTIAEKMGYVARKPSAKPNGDTGRKPTVLIVENESAGESTNETWMADAYRSFMGKILEASGSYLQNRGIVLTVLHLGESQQLTQWLADSDVIGVLWHGADSDSGLLHWVASRFPLVLMNRDWRAAVPFDSVSVDQAQNILLATEHLWTHGHRRIATFGHNPKQSIYRRRMAAYQQFVEERGLRNYAEFQQISDDLGMPALTKVEAILDTWTRLGSEAPTALVTGDVFALPLLRAAQRRGIRIPEDLSVVGIDNTAPCTFVHPALTSMEGCFEEMCRVAVDLLLRRKANGDAPAQTVQIAPRLVERESVRMISAEAKTARTAIN